MTSQGKGKEILNKKRILTVNAVCLLLIAVCFFAGVLREKASFYESESGAAARIDIRLFLFVTIALILLLIFDLTALLRINKSLQNAVLAADAASGAKSGFLSNMSHEIRTPITAILGMNELIRRKSRDPGILEYAENIQTAGTGLLNILSDILDFSKIETGKMQLEEAPYRIRDMVSDLENLTALRADSKGLAFQIRIDPMLPSVLVGDVQKLKQVITNLLTNNYLSDNLGKFIGGLLKKPGDHAEAFITKTNRQVIKVTTDGIKRSAVRYPSGRIVETISYMEK